MHTAPRLQLADAYAASVETGIKPGTIRQWLHRGKLTRHGYDTAGRALIDLAELRNLKGT
ncbi:hypothetical protein RVR_5810 [Actinacidiphila reveromycinica]|uniref:DNA-binding protein n=1 Tax=Actinacidiphila reveromycinica TaxID=659352 RepID=A0A7U3UV15_9ACTN|nr:hypothetical protein [Streptomyces sp. SN-593]BBA99266.1 hypothetical protein RVR_5810 [Streptomyces sp. SN-593]